MSIEDFDTLLGRMEKIASAVNAFKSEAIQREAFQALVSSLESKKAAIQGEPKSRASAPKSEGKGQKKQEKPKASRRKASYTTKLLKDLDLAPAGKTSLQDFVKAKQPGSNEDRYAVVVYYLQHELNLTGITLNHIASVFRMTPGWKEPTNVRSGITTAASRKATIDTSNFDDLKTTPQGRNFVEHELPRKPRKARPAPQ